ncbi:MAG TPA: pilus assembly protein TadG-related protein [Terriglobales bacterium]|jgi:Flp pilus assembly protein TadG|nr:pilus assembly protein TadG-related protein [Terriglobales bacterium]
MRRKKNISGRKLDRKNERGVVITLVAVFMLCVVGAMAALSIDVVTIYTARSEAQLAADGAALAAARVIANSGATSDPTGTLLGTVEAAAGPAQNVAVQVAEQNQVGGTYLTGANILTPTFAGTYTNPTVTVKVQVTNLPTFFARIWGTKFVTVAASATAEAYNPSGVVGTSSTTKLPVAPMCVKPWLLPNIDPSGGTTIFDPNSGTITNRNLLGWTSSSAATRLSVACPNGNCSGQLTGPVVAWKYYPGDPATNFPPPTQALPSCTPALATPYEESVAGCIQTALACNSTGVNIDFSNYGNNRNRETAEAVNCLTHARDGGDVVTSTAPPSSPFEFVAGAGNPIPGASGNDVMVSDSLVTVPVYDSGTDQNPPTGPVTIVGFVELFLNPNGQPTPAFGPNRGLVNTTIINMTGCGTSTTGAPAAILGNGASPVAVRLISP